MKSIMAKTKRKKYIKKQELKKKDLA